MATSAELKLRRGTAAQVAAFTGAAGEVTPDTTNNRLVLHDGTTAGGHPQASEAYVDDAIAALPSGGGDMFKADNLSGLASTSTALTNLGGTTVGKALFTAADAAAPRAAIGVYKPRGHIFGLTLSNNATDATNDIDIAAGEAADASGNLLVLASGITKRLDAAWAVGSGNGGLDTGSIANGTYHVWLIQRSDTGVVDVLLSKSASSPTIPANYDSKRRIGSILRESTAIVAFRQTGDVFKRLTQVVARNSTTPVTDTLLRLRTY
jgi:hypothetical protein